MSNVGSYYAHPKYVGRTLRMVAYRFNDNIYTNGREYLITDIGGRLHICSNTGNMNLLSDISLSKFVLVREAKPTYPNPPHKHAELIKAWADGAEIELNTPEGWVKVRPDWSGPEYRIKPQRSNKDIQIDKLEQQAKDLANEIRKLKE